MSILSQPHYHNEEAAFAKLESIVWPNGPVCPHCGGIEKIYKIKPNPEKRVRQGLHKCGQCKGQFTAKIGTVFEHSRVPLYKWFQAAFLLASSKRGTSSNQLSRTLEVTLKTAWFMSHRLREAMRSGEFAPMGGNGKVVEADETFIGHDKTKKPKGSKKGRGVHHKFKVLTLVERGGKAYSMVVDDLKTGTIVPILRKNIHRETKVMTDEAGQYVHLHCDFAHDFVSHGKGEYGRGEVHTNTIEGYFSIFKRGMKGVYQHCSERHLHRYMAEFDFRYNHRIALGGDDKARTEALLGGIVGKRLTYRDSFSEPA